MSVQARLERLEKASRMRTYTRGVAIRLAGESDAQTLRRVRAPADTVIVESIQQAYMLLLKGGRLYPVADDAEVSDVDEWISRMGVMR